MSDVARPALFSPITTLDKKHLGAVQCVQVLDGVVTKLGFSSPSQRRPLKPGMYAFVEHEGFLYVQVVSKTDHTEFNTGHDGIWAAVNRHLGVDLAPGSASAGEILIGEDFHVLNICFKTGTFYGSLGLLSEEVQEASLARMGINAALLVSVREYEKVVQRLIADHYFAHVDVGGYYVCSPLAGMTRQGYAERITPKLTPLAGAGSAAAVAEPVDEPVAAVSAEFRARASSSIDAAFSPQGIFAQGRPPRAPSGAGEGVATAPAGSPLDSRDSVAEDLFRSSSDTGSSSVIGARAPDAGHDDNSLIVPAFCGASDDDLEALSSDESPSIGTPASTGFFAGAGAPAGGASASAGDQTQKPSLKA